MDDQIERPGRAVARSARWKVSHAQILLVGFVAGLRGSVSLHSTISNGAPYGARKISEPRSAKVFVDCPRSTNGSLLSGRSLDQRGARHRLLFAQCERECGVDGLPSSDRASRAVEIRSGEENTLGLGRFAAIWVATAILFAASPLMAPDSLSQAAIFSMLPFAAISALVAVGQTLVVQQRGLDLSVPGAISLAALAVGPNSPISRMRWFRPRSPHALRRRTCSISSMASRLPCSASRLSLRRSGSTPCSLASCSGIPAARRRGLRARSINGRSPRPWDCPIRSS